MTATPKIDEVAPDVFRLCTYVPEINLQFIQFLVRDEEPVLIHTGMKGLLPLVKAGVAQLIKPKDLRWITFSHFEADECGSLAEWLTLAPHSTAVCSMVGKLVNVDDMIGVRPAQALQDGEVLATGKYRFRFLNTPHVPHCWDAGLLLEETQGTLFCSDLMHQCGDVEASTTRDVVGRFSAALAEYQRGPLADYLPYSRKTHETLMRLADLKPRTLAAMHGSTFIGDCAQALRDYDTAAAELLA